VEIERGSVWYAELPRVGAKAVLVVSWDAINAGLRSPIVCQVTRSERERSFPTYVALAAGDGGLEHDSFVLCHELATIDVSDLRRRLGTISPASMIEIEAALRRALDLP
jgi:mRNA interferase MazF